MFVRHGDPPPTEWMAAHPGWVKFPATLVPRPAGSARPGRASLPVPGAESGSVESGMAWPVSMGAPMVQRPGLRNRGRPPRFPGRFGEEESQGPREDPVAAYLRVTESLATMGLVEPVAAWRGRHPHGAENAAASAPASVPAMPPDVNADLRASAEGLAYDLVPVGSYRVAQLEGPPEEAERLGPTGQPLSLQEEANINMYYNAFRSLQDIDPTNPALTREVVRPTDWVPSDADVQDIQRALDTARQPAVTPGSALQEELGSRSREAYDALAADPSHGNQNIPKAIQERRVGLNAERQGLLPGPITRDPTGAAEFIDATGQA